MKIAQIGLLAYSLDALPTELTSIQPYNYDESSYDSLDERKVPNRHPKARLRTLGKA